jgi:subtilisin-like proprotein convertase family protein
MATAIAAVLAIPGTAMADQSYPVSFAHSEAGANAPGPNDRTSFPLHTRDPQAIAVAKAEAASGNKGGRPAEGDATTSPGPDTVIAGGGLNLPGLTDPSGAPPDTTGAIGPNHYVELVNSRVAAYDRRLNLIDFLPENTFFGAPNDSVCDGQMMWDQTTRRFYYAGLDCDGGSPNHLYYGWSKTNDPTDFNLGWCKFQINTAGNLEDYPKLGDDNTHLTIGDNVFVGNTFTGVHVWAIPKPPGGTTCPAPPASVTPLAGVGTATPLTGVVTPVPANITDGSAAGYVVSAADPTGGPATNVHVYKIGVSSGNATFANLGDVTVNSFTFPANVPQPGGPPDVIDSLDARLTQAVGHKDPGAGNKQTVWTQHTVCAGGTTSACNSAGGRGVVRWYEIVPEPLSLRQQGTVAKSPNWAFNGSISPAGNGSTAALAFNVGGASAPAQINAQSRQSGTPLGTTTGDIKLATSAAADHDFTCPSQSGFSDPCRWGDYAGVTPDPTATDVVWGSNQTNGPVGGGGAIQWQTRNFALAFSAVADLVHNLTTATDGNDNVIKPGEQFHIAEQIKNIGGAAAAGITGTLQSNTNGLSINQGSSPYPNTAAGATGTNATPFTATMGAGVACGKTLAMNLHLTSAQGQFDAPVKVSSGAQGALQTFNAISPQVPKAIPDPGTVTSTITIGQTALLKKVAVKIGDIHHTFDSDLEITIKAPDGTTVPLVFDRGGSGDNFINTVFTDSASTPIGNGSAPFTGSFKPESPLAALQGHQMKGTWTLTVTDTFPADSGTLNAWSQQLNPATC